MQRQLKNLKFLHKGTIKCQCFASLGTNGTIRGGWKLLSIKYSNTIREKSFYGKSIPFNFNKHKTHLCSLEASNNLTGE